MEKINTPLMAEIESQSKIIKIEESKRDADEKFNPMIIIKAMHTVKVLESLLTTEREVIEKSYNDGKTQAFLENRNAYQERLRGYNYFTQTFKSYE